MRWSSPFSSFYGNLPDVFNAKSRQDDKENLANQSWTFGEKSPVKAENKWLPSSKPATPTSLRVVPRKKISAQLRVHQALQSDDEDDKFEYLAQRSFPAEALPPVLAGTLLLDTLSTPPAPPEPEFIELWALDNIPRDVDGDTRTTALSQDGMSSTPSLVSNDPFTSRSAPDAPAGFSEAASSPEISPFKTFTTTKVSLGFAIAEPDVSIPDVRPRDDHSEEEDVRKNKENVDYSENCGDDMILESDGESISSVPDSPMPIVFTSSPAPPRPSAWQIDSEHEEAGEQEYDGEDEEDDMTEDEDMALESDSGSISFAFGCPTPAVSALLPNSPVLQPVVLRLNPEAQPFIPRWSVLSCAAPVLAPAPGPSPATEVRLSLSVSSLHVDDARTVTKHEDESMSPTIYYLWPAETNDVDDIAFLRYFGLIDLAAP